MAPSCQVPSASILAREKKRRKERKRVRARGSNSLERREKEEREQENKKQTHTAACFPSLGEGVSVDLVSYYWTVWGIIQSVQMPVCNF